LKGNLRLNNKIKAEEIDNTYHHFKHSRYYKNKSLDWIDPNTYKPFQKSKKGNNYLNWIILGTLILIVVYFSFSRNNRLGLDTKTFWDWLELLIVPAVLALGGFLFSNAQRKSDLEVAEKERQADREIAKDRQRQNILDEYFDRITELLLTDKLNSENFHSYSHSNAYKIARIRTLVAFRVLDIERNQQIGRFLRESDILSNKKVFSLNYEKVDLEKAELGEIDFSNVNFHSANFANANLRKANLNNTDLSKANLYSADLSGAILNNADLSHANLTYADLSGAKLNGANLRNANLLGAVLTGAEIRQADIRDADLRGALIFDAIIEDFKFIKLTKRIMKYPSADLTGTKYNRNTKFTEFNEKGLGHKSIHLANVSFVQLAAKS